MLLGNEVVVYAIIVNEGDWDKTFFTLRDKNALPSAEEIKNTVQAYQGKYITILDKQYPDWLRQSVRPPLALFYEGDLSLIKDKQRLVGITGSWNNESKYADEMTAKIASEITKQGCVVVSGLGKSVPSIALSSAIKEGPCVAILSTGIDRHYPAEFSELQDSIAQKGLVLSPFPFGVNPTPDRVRVRNVLLGQLVHFLFVTAIKAHDGVLLTIAAALHEGRDVGCLPYHADEEFENNALIRQGAALIDSAESLLYEMGFDEKKDKGQK